MAKKAETGEHVGDEPIARLDADIASALRRKPAQEPRLAGVLRALAPHSGRARDAAARAVDVLARRGSFDRPLYAAGVRALSELGDRRATSPLEAALCSDGAGGLASLSAACFSHDQALGPALVRVATSRHPHLAFAAEVARVMRGESSGEHITSVAPKIKESHRIALCTELFVPLSRANAAPISITPALAVLRDSERHLGRWLVLGEIAVRAGDSRPLEEARKRAAAGPTSARAAWTMVAWALNGSTGPAPSIRPTVELVARLSDRPSADRDTTFLYRLAAAKVAGARPMLETLAKGSSLSNETAIRSAMYLAREYGRNDLTRALGTAAVSGRREVLRGVAAAALYDVGEHERCAALADSLVSSRQLPTVAWGGLIRAALEGSVKNLVTEPTFRRVQLGWVE